MEHLVTLTARQTVIFIYPLELSMQNQLTAPLTYLTSTKPDRPDGVLLPTPCQPHPKTFFCSISSKPTLHRCLHQKKKKQQKQIYQQYKRAPPSASQAAHSRECCLRTHHLHASPSNSKAKQRFVSQLHGR